MRAPAAPALLVLASAILLTGCASTPPGVPPVVAAELPSFASCEDLTARIDAGARGGAGMFDRTVNSVGAPEMAQNAPAASPPRTGGGSDGDFSRTNVQVAGVDEADSVKTDGRYIYTLSGGGIAIVAAVPASSMRQLAKIEFEKDGLHPREFFVDGDRLIVLGQSQLLRRLPERYTSGSFIRVYDMTDRARPRIVRTLEVEGDYRTARMVDGQVYGVFLSYPQWYGEGRGPREPVPMFRDSRAGDAMAPITGCGDVRYFPPSRASQFVTVLALDAKDAEGTVTKEVVYGGGDNVYSSAKNLYVATTELPGYGTYNGPRMLRPWLAPSSGRNERTHVYRFALNEGAVRYDATGSVPGTVLNQFSMDEHEGRFRIATTVGEVFDGRSVNNLYVLDGSLAIEGSLTGLARGERIYSARFMGDRAYLVTFKKVDPLFVLDLKDPKQPKVLGELKIPGYSDYLHPYDENHIIGLGKDAADAGPAGDFAWYQGLKLALFDVSDVANPKELHSVVVGDRGSESPALHDHKAFLFDRSRNLLVLPVTVAEAAARPYEASGIPGMMPSYGEPVFTGAYVWNLTTANGFDLKGKIAHGAPSESAAGSASTAIFRTLTIGDTLYALSAARLTAHDFRAPEKAVGDLALRGATVSSGGWVTE